MYRVDKKGWETRDTFTLALVPENGDGMRFSAGQFNMLYAFGVGECAISISGDPDQCDGPLLHTVRNVGTVTAALRHLREGDPVGVRGPFGRGWPMVAAEGKNLLFIAGGIGLAPLRPAVYHALNRPDSYGKVSLLAGARSPDDLLFMNEVSEWRTDALVTVDHADQQWHGHVGVVTPYIRKMDIDVEHTAAMICGPEIMMRYSVQELLNMGMPAHNIFITMERNMKCAVGFCGHCQLGPNFICKDGPVFNYKDIQFWFDQREF